jgi:WD40 repeat protein
VHGGHADIIKGLSTLINFSHTGRHGCICTFDSDEEDEDITMVHDPECPHVGHSDPAWSVSFAPDGDTLFSSSDDGTVKSWDAATGALRHTFVVGSQVRDLGPDGFINFQHLESVGILSPNNQHQHRTVRARKCVPDCPTRCANY